MIRFASIRFDHALDEDDRRMVTRALASRHTSITSWATAAERTYAIASGSELSGEANIAGLRVRVDAPPLLVLGVRPAFARAIPALVDALGGPGRPASILACRATADGAVVEVEPSGRALRLVLAVVDATLAATPGRTVTPVLPLSDDVLAAYVAARVGADLDVSRILDPYVEHLLAPGVTGS